MTISIEIPSDVEEALRAQFGPEFAQQARQDLAAAWFAEGRISSRHVAAMLGMSLFEAHAFLKTKGASMPMSLDEVERDLASLRAVGRS